jgi:hypothetical protein
MNHQLDITESLVELISLLSVLQSIESNRFLSKFGDIKCPIALLGLTRELDYAANSKELRDTGNPQVHQLLNQITLKIEKFRSFFFVNLYPNSTAQRMRWSREIADERTAARVIRADGSFQLHLLDTRIKQGFLEVGPRSSFMITDEFSMKLKIDLDADQTQEVKKKLALIKTFGLSEL